MGFWFFGPSPLSVEQPGDGARSEQSDSSATGFVRHEIVLELVCRADLSCKLSCKTSPADMERSWG